MYERYYFLLTSLPDLPALGESPPMDLRQFRISAAEEDSAAAMVEAVLLEQDLVLREAVLAGEIEQAEGIVLTDGQVAGDDPLPDFLAGPADRQYRIAADAVWEAYYRYVSRMAAARRNRFLRDWAGFEVALRNALAEARSRKLGLEPHDYLVADDIAADLEDDFGQPGRAAADVVSAWAEAPGPLAALRVLDERRRQWLEEHARYFTFAVDELLAYARGLVLVSRWHALSSTVNAQEGN